MTSATKAQVVVLYAHPILGEGLALLLSSQPGVGAVAVDLRDAEARAAALSRQPDLVIVEETEPPRAHETAGSMPVVFVRLDAEGRPAPGERLADPEAIAALAHDLVRNRL